MNSKYIQNTYTYSENNENITYILLDINFYAFHSLHDIISYIINLAEKCIVYGNPGTEVSVEESMVDGGEVPDGGEGGGGSCRRMKKEELREEMEKIVEDLKGEKKRKEGSEGLGASSVKAATLNMITQVS